MARGKAPGSKGSAPKEASRFAAFVADLLQPMGPVVARRMFSGSGLFCDGLMFALIINDVLYLKADEANQPQFEAEGMGPFLYTARGRSIAINYWRAPERLMDEPDDLVAWSRAALGVARKLAAGKVKKARAPTPAKAAPAKRPNARKPGKRTKPQGRKQTNT